MDRSHIFLMALYLVCAGPVMAQSPALLPTSAAAPTSGAAQSPAPAPHRLTRNQIAEIRRIETDRQDEQVGRTEFSMPGSTRGSAIKSTESLNRLMAKMSHHDRRAFLAQPKTAFNGQDFDAAVKVAKNLVLYELHVTETEHAKPLIDVDGDGTLDQVDAIRYSGPEFQNHRLCGPTIVLERNQKLIINLKNKLKQSREPVLDWNPGFEPPSPPDPPAYWTADAPHELFSTNLHMHGLHVCPGSRHDNTFLDLPPSSGSTPNELFLDYQLPADHVAGTFWYHAHRHGSVAYQLANGMAGALIVLGDPDPASNDLESLPEIQAANLIRHPTDSAKDVDYGRVLLLQQLVFTKTTVAATDPGGGSVSRWIVDPADINDRKSAPNEKNVGRIAEGIPANKPDPDEVLAVNGQNAPSIDIQRGQIERWRLIHAGRESALNLAWYNARDLKDSSIEVPDVTPVIESYEIATDGIPTGRSKKVTNTELYPGYRVDLLIRVTDRATDGEYWLLPCEAQRLTRTHLGPVKNATPVAKLIVRGQLATAMTLPTNAMMKRFKRPAPDVTGAETLDLRFTFADKERFGVANTAHGVGKPYAETGSAESIDITLNTPQVWSLGVREFLPGVPEAVKHPFHMHVNPFYVPSLDVWKDTIVVSREEVTEIRFLPTDYAGRSVLHCHILDHEDQGMMKDINIVGTSRSQYPDLYRLERIPAESQIRIDGINLKPGKNNVLVFINGLGCPHCAESTIKLWKRSDPLKNLNAAIKCMSATSFEQKDLTSLGLSKKEHFTFHVVQAGFDVAQYDSPSILPSDDSSQNPKQITHGVLIFDKQQNLRYRYLGDRPLDDLDDITYALMELEETLHSPKGKFHGVASPREIHRE